MFARRDRSGQDPQRSLTSSLNVLDAHRERQPRTHTETILTSEPFQRGRQPAGATTRMNDVAENGMWCCATLFLGGRMINPAKSACIA
jgi:hypothetical protein